MTSITTTNRHRPVELVTEDYTYEGSWDNEPPEPPVFGELSAELMALWTQAMDWWRQEKQALTAKVSTSDVGERGLGQCHHCGAALRYSAIMHHVPSGQYIAVGETCLDNRFSLATADFKKLRKENKLGAERRKRDLKVKEVCDQYPELEWLVPGSELPEASRNNHFVLDVRSRFWQYGDLSERQYKAIVKAVERDAERAAEKAQEAPAGPVPTGKAIDIEGTVVSRKERHTDFGVTWKIVVKLENGSAVWFTEPSKVKVHRGDVIKCRLSTITASDKDETFGFGKRPTRWEFVSQVDINEDGYTRNPETGYYEMNEEAE